MKDRIIYADNAATTRVLPEVAEAMLPYLTEDYGNPSSLHKIGREAKKALEESRAKVAALLNCAPNEIYFTGSGTEADNWAIKGAAVLAAQKRKIASPHIITTKIEHHAVLHTFKALEKQGFTATYVDVDKYGTVNPQDILAAVTPDTVLVAVMYANNEVGTIEPIAEIAKALEGKNIVFFSDAVQAVGHIPIDVKACGVDMLSLSGHKFHAPKGIGALYIRKGVRIANLIDGGGQERGGRSGTENVAAVVALSKALEIAVSRLKDNDRLTALRDRLISGITKIPYSALTGHPENRLPGNASFVFSYIEGESLLLLLDMAGICVSTGSACSSTSLEPSHVLLSLGIEREVSHGSLRLTISHDTTEEEVDYIIQKTKEAVERLRKMSPLYEGKEI